jgi:hypothetical protein
MLVFAETGDRAGEALTLTNIASVFDRMGDHDHALDNLQRALDICVEIGDLALEATTRQIIALAR